MTPPSPAPRPRWRAGGRRRSGRRDGFMPGHSVAMPRDLIGIAALPVPELRRRGRFRTEDRGLTPAETLAEA